MDSIPDNEIDIGDEITYTPTKRKYEDELTGFVAERLNGGTGYEVLAPLEGDPQRSIRIWRDNGIIVKTGKEADWKMKIVDEVKPAAPSPQKPYKHPSDLASQYKAAGLSRQESWNQFVKDTILQPVYRSEDTNADVFFKYYDLG